jgi:hypothetical protein
MWCILAQGRRIEARRRRTPWITRSEDTHTHTHTDAHVQMRKQTMMMIMIALGLDRRNCPPGVRILSHWGEEEEV